MKPRPDALFKAVDRLTPMARRGRFVDVYTGVSIDPDRRILHVYRKPGDAAFDAVVRRIAAGADVAVRLHDTVRSERETRALTREVISITMDDPELKKVTVSVSFGSEGNVSVGTTDDGTSTRRALGHLVRVVTVNPY